MTTVLLAGILAAFVAVTLAAGMRRAPAHVLCPACTAKTETVQPPTWLRKTAPDLRVRWCPSCSWKGVGGGVPGVGFDWGEARTPRDLGFQFADKTAAYGAAAPEPTTPEQRPAHPSGFRFAGDEKPAAVDPTEAEPEGADGPFAWADPAAPKGFQWRDQGPSAVPVFRWKG